MAATWNASSASRPPSTAGPGRANAFVLRGVAAPIGASGRTQRNDGVKARHCGEIGDRGYLTAVPRQPLNDWVANAAGVAVGVGDDDGQALRAALDLTLTIKKLPGRTGHFRVLTPIFADGFPGRSAWTERRGGAVRGGWIRLSEAISDDPGRRRGFDLVEGLSLTGRLPFGWRIDTGGLAGGGTRSEQHDDGLTISTA